MSKSHHISRRSFLKFTALFAAVPFVDTMFERSKLFAAGIKKFSTDLVINGEVLTGAHWGIIKATVKDGKVISSKNAVETTIDNPFVKTISDLVYAEDRVRYPMVRKSYLANPDDPKRELRGSEEWVQVSYEKAIKLIANELKKTYKQKGPSGVFAGSYGWFSPGKLHNSRILLQRFMKMAGGYVGSTGDYSTGAAQVIMPHVMGTIEVYEQQTSWPVILDNTKVIVIWGADPIRTLRIAWSITDAQGLEYFNKLKKSGIKVIHITPVKNDTCDFLGGEWIAPVPNTDVAMMIGMAYHLHSTNLYNKEFIEEYTEGFDKFEEYLLGKSDGVKKTPEWASKICGIPEGKIKELAELFYNNRTMLMSGWGMQRAHHGDQPHWALVTLASMLGQIGLAGGGFGLSYHYSNGGIPTTDAPVLGGINVGSSESSGGADWLLNAAASSFPVARVADALLNPGKTIDNNGKKITYSDIDFIYWAGGNPLVHHQDTNNLIKAFRKPRTVVVNEIYWTPTARMADIVMPITSIYERNDLSMSGDYSNLNIVPMKQVVKKQYESVDDYKVFSDLAKEFDIFEKFTENKDEMTWLREFYGVAEKQAKAKSMEFPTFEEFWTKNEPLSFESTIESDEFIRHADYIEDPLLNPLGTPSGKIEIFSQTIANMNYDDCAGHAKWFEPVEWLGMKNKPAEFHMISAHPSNRLHSQLANTSLRKLNVVANKEPIWINTNDAKKKNIKTGDVVRVFNSRGQVLAGAFVTDKIREGVVNLTEGAWYDPENPSEKDTLCKNGSPNVLTIDIPTSKLSNGNISHTALVNVEKFTGKVSDLTVFKQPKTVKA
ncbi:MAG: trimethylamine-N-oxide reductase TorA [Campylobacteraceae bacterium]